MIERWSMSFSPTERGENRYKIRVWADETDLRELMEKIGSICSRPFIPQDEGYNWAFYVYNVDQKKKEEIIEILDELIGQGKVTTPEKELVRAESEGEESEKTPLLTEEVKLNPLYTFDNFVVGPSNRFTHAACQAVAKSPGVIYNPLFIYGGVGLGKTHLLHAIGHYVRNARPEAKVVYTTTERFINEVISAIAKGTLDTFRKHYRMVDVLLIDDIQFLAESESTQEEFFHTFNVLHDAHKQIVITSDKPPKQLTTLEDRLKSRFEWGLIADIRSPDLETRIAILKKKEEMENLDLSDNILLYIAGKLKSNIRELEGFLKRINAYSKLTKQEITLELVKELMDDLLPGPEKEKVEEKEEQPVLAEEPTREEPAVTAEEKSMETVVTPQPRPEAVSDKDKIVDKSLRKVDVVYFYPEDCKAEFEELKSNFAEVLKKHNLRFRLEAVFQKEYRVEKPINYGMFVEVCRTAGVKIAIVLGPPLGSGLSTEEFSHMLNVVLADADISLHFISATDIKKKYKYLNLLLDIAMVGHKGT